MILASLFTCALSLGLLAVATGLGGLSWPSGSSEVSGDLLWLAPVIVFGFLLCPYLDLSFHHARPGARWRAW